MFLTHKAIHLEAAYPSLGYTFSAMLGDLLKGLIPVLIARALTDNAWIIAVAALAAVIGACWSVFLNFKGGKGVATGAGTSIGLAPLIGLGLFVFWWVVVLLSRYT